MKKSTAYDKETPDQLQSLLGVPLCIQIMAFISSLCGKLLTGTNTPFAISDPRMTAFLILLFYDARRYEEEAFSYRLHWQS